MRVLIIMMGLSSCVPTGQFGGKVIVEPVEALQLCDGDVRSYSALTGKIECNNK